tara:strand:+ start:752 stop:1060 length:309 start_codon:yes stop_codon:yes gene_type:complete
MKPTTFEAVLALVGGGISSTIDGKIYYHDGQTPPTEKAIEAKLKELQDEYEAKQYQRDRQPEYPAIGDQLDMLFHAIDAGKVDKTSDFYKSLKAVKDKYPKG